MSLTLQVTTYKNHAPAEELSITVNEDICTIGRAADNVFVLPDMERIISHHHARIQYENGDYYITDKSTNGTFINYAREPIGQNKVRLHDGDILSFGDYNCAVQLKQPQQAITPLPGKASRRSSLPQDIEEHRKSPLPADFYEQETERGDDAGLVSTLSPGSGSAGQAVQAPQQDYFRPPEAIPEDWNLLTGEMPVAEPEKKPTIPKSQQKTAPSKAMDLEIKPAKTKATTTSGNSASSTDRAAIDAFLAGAGLSDIDLQSNDIPAFMHLAGQVMREITQGFRQVLASRTNIKGEFRLGVTTIHPVENNPLKFSIDAEDALTKLLLQESKGFLPPIDAIQEATDDIQAHQMALLAGLRAALSSLVSMFDPETLEKDFQKTSAIDNLLPYARKAKYWELFKSRYRQTAADAENDFLHFLGDEFAIAYEQQIQKLKSARHYNI